MGRRRTSTEFASNLPPMMPREKLRALLLEMVAVRGKPRRRAAFERIRNRIVHGNLRLVAAIAARFTGRGVELHDLIQAGSIGLARALESFDPGRGCALSTYGTGWIQHYVRREVEN